MLTNGTSFNATSQEQLNKSINSLPNYYPSSSGLTGNFFFAVFDKATYGNEEYLNVSTFYKKMQNNTNPLYNKYGYSVYVGDHNIVGPYSINIGQGVVPIIYFKTNDISTVAIPNTKNEMAFSSKIIDFSNFRSLSFNSPTLTPPFMISDIVYSDNPTTDNIGTSLLFNWIIGEYYSSYKSTYVEVRGEKNNPNMSATISFTFSNSTKYIGLVCNNTVIVWFRGTLTQTTDYGTFYFPYHYFNFSSIFPNLY